ncbi:MAG: FIST N-terminal domain-containing protein [Acidimicrobiales bacterium]
MEVAAALSEHPLPTHAVGDATGEVLEQLGGAPDVAAVFVTSGHAGALEDIAAAVRAILSPSLLVGAASTAVIGGHREVEDRPGIAVWAARSRGVAPVRIETRRTDDGWTIQGLPRRAADGDRMLVLFADPFSFPAEGFLEELRSTCPRLTVVGGMAAGAQGPGGSRLLLGDQIHTDGAVGLLLPKDADVAAVVSQGCRPIGEPLVVTRSERNVIFELGGRPALERLREVVEELDPDDRARASAGLHLGLVMDEGQATFGTGDFVIRNVIGADTSAGAVGVAEMVPVGHTVQFHLRDAATADLDLRASLSSIEGDGALVFTCTGRGHDLFGYPDHDADVVAAALGTRATAGFFSANELGPVGGQNFLHGFATSVLVFGPRPT